MDFKHMLLYKLAQVFGVLGGIGLIIFGLLLFSAISGWAIILIILGIVLLVVGFSAKHMVFKDLFPDGRTYHEGHTTHTRNTTYRRRKGTGMRWF